MLGARGAGRVVADRRRPGRAGDRHGIHPEFAGYGGQLVKQADVTLLQYPWAQPMPKTVAQNDLNYYVPRTDPGGPSMATPSTRSTPPRWASPGCASYVFTQRSFEPFIRDAFDQFSETRTGGAFTFMTGIGGFLQEFLYGYSGLRWGRRGAPRPEPHRQLSGVVLHNLHWHGRTSRLGRPPRTTTVTLDTAPAAAVPTPPGDDARPCGRTADGRHPPAGPRRRPTRALPARRRSSSAHAGAPAGGGRRQPGTDWQPRRCPQR